MLNEFLFIALLFLTRVILPLVVLLVVGQWIARRTNRESQAHS